MDNRFTTFGISRKNAGLWISSFLMLAAAALRIIYFAMGGAEGRTLGGRVFLLAVIPAAAALIFIAELWIHGRDRLYKTGFSVLLITVFLIVRIIFIYKEAQGACPVWLLVACLVLYCAQLIVWNLTTNGARIKTRLPLVMLLALPVLYFAVSLFTPLPGAETGAPALLSSLSVVLMLLAMLACALFMQRITSEEYRPRRGDRPDGRLVRSLDPINGVAVYIMPTRNGSSTYFRDTIECSKVEEFIRRKREEGMPGFGMLHLIAAAYVRVLSKHPACNRFISGQKIYSHGNVLELALAVKKEMRADAPETIIKVYFDPNDTVEDVYRKVSEQIEIAKNTPLDSGFDDLAWLINAVPGILKKLLVWILKVFDYFGWLPAWLMRLSPFHGSVFVTDLGSLGIPPIYHHLYDFGNIPVFVAFGSRRSENEVGPDGTPVKKKYIDFTIVTDERICDGFYYASAFKSFRRFLNNPEKLEAPPEKVEKDVY
ncbi:MAG: hypothetical protein IKP26_02065 [Clostridia bacterium]|nr:hypothetical protein [Clostridia bacterium]